MASPIHFKCSPWLRRRRVALGLLIRHRRNALRLSQETLAERADRGRQSICRAEHGQFSPTLDDWWTLADALGIPLSELIREVEDHVATQDKEKSHDSTDRVHSRAAAQGAHRRSQAPVHQRDHGATARRKVGR